MRLALCALLLAAATSGQDDPAGEKSSAIERAQTLIAQADALKEAGKHADAGVIYRKAIAVLDEHAIENNETARVLNDWAFSLFMTGRPAGALAALERALAIRRRLFDGDHEAVATSLYNLGRNLSAMGRHRDALFAHEEALAMRRRVLKGPHRDIIWSLYGLGAAHRALGSTAKALPLLEEALALDRRRRGPGPSASLAISLNNLAVLYGELGRHADSLPLKEEALAMRRRLFDADHVDVAQSLENLAVTCAALGSNDKALSLYEEALAMRRRLHKGDHVDLARTLGNFAHACRGAGRHDGALRLGEEALAMRQRVLKGDHRDVAWSLSDVAGTYLTLGRLEDALRLNTAAVAMRRRLFDPDHPDLATGLSGLASVYNALGRHAEALPLLEEALAIGQRRSGRDDPALAKDQSKLAVTMSALGRHEEALELEKEVLAKRQRMFGDKHTGVATSLNNLAAYLLELGRYEDALAPQGEALRVFRDLFEGDHPRIAASLGNLATLYSRLGRHEDALPLFERTLAMSRRLFGSDHPDVALSLNNLAHACRLVGRDADAVRLWAKSIAVGKRIGWSKLHRPLVALARHLLRADDAAAAVPLLETAIDHVESRRAAGRSLGIEGSARYAAELRASDPFPAMVEAQVGLRKPARALDYLERGRARAMLDLLARGSVDPMAQAAARARASDDDQAQARIEAAQADVRRADADVVRCSLATRRARASGELESIRIAAAAEHDARRRLLQALRRRLALVREYLPETRPRQSGEMRALLESGQHMLVYGPGETRSFVFLVGPEIVTSFVIDMPTRESIDDYVATLARREAASPSEALFERLIPAPVWNRIQTAAHVYVLPYGSLHTAPFEALTVKGTGRSWMEVGPPVSYAASGSVLAWLRRGRETARSLLVAVGDPAFVAAAWPETGVLVERVAPAGQAAALGLRPGDVIVGWGEQEVTDLVSLVAAAKSITTATAPLRFVRDGETRIVDARAGRLGVQLSRDPPPVAGPKLLGPGRLRHSATRHGNLAPLPGTRAEVRSIARALEAIHPGAKTIALLGKAATEARLFAEARGARYVHLATHGLIDETRSASFSALALTPPQLPVPGNDGFLTLADLLERWRGRLDRTELVVLSACESQRGRLEADEGMLSLAWGFCFAGARAVVGSLWKVDDKSTAKLMAEFYRRMATGERKAKALLEAKRALAKSHPAPYHWAPFVLLGDPR